jgi:hypothetical protein
MITFTKWGLAIVAAIAVASCSVGSDACGKGFKEKMGGCVKVTAAGGKKATPVKDADTDSDAIADETVVGMGDSCATQQDCEGKDANYCALDPVNGIGICTRKDCTLSPDNCPTGYRCCPMPKELKYPYMCLSPDMYDMAVGLGFCPK